MKTTNLSWRYFAMALLLICASCSDEGSAKPTTAPTSTVTPPDVYVPPNATLDRVEIVPASPTLAAGESTQLLTRGTWSDGTVTELREAEGATWASSDPSVASVTSAGLLTGVRAGQSTITASAPGNHSVSTVVTVTESQLVSLQVTASSGSLSVGGTSHLVATGVYSDGTARDVTTQATWTVSDASVASLSGSTLTGLKGGTTAVTASYGNRAGRFTLVVTARSAVALQVTPPAAQIRVGDTTPFVATVVYSDGSSRVLTTGVVWSSSSPGVATVSAIGVVTGAGVGVGTITASAEGATGTAAIVVTSTTVISVQVSPVWTLLEAGRTVQLSALAYRSDGSTVDVTSSAIWSVDNEALAQVTPGGLVTGISTGVANVSANYGGLGGVAQIQVTAPYVVGLELSVPSATLNAGETLRVTATARFSNGARSDVTHAAQWTSSLPSVASVSQGVVTALGSGTVSISALYGGFSNNLFVTVASAQTYQVGGSVSGLDGTVVLANGTDHVTISTDGPYAFPVKLATGASYEVVVSNDPQGQTCTVYPNAGVIGSADVTNLSVTCQNDGPAWRYWFVTASTFSGGFGASAAGAIAAADAACNSDGNKPDARTYKAMLVNSARKACTTDMCGGGPSEHLDWVLAANTEYRRVDGTTVILTTNANGIFDFFNMPQGVTQNMQNVWTGLNGQYHGMNAGWLNSADNCNDWTDASGGPLGEFAASSMTSDMMIDIRSGAGCGSNFKLYCVGQ